MSIEYGFFASVNQDRIYSDTDFANYYKSLVGNGVILSSAEALQVTAGSNMTLFVNPGGAMIEGRYCRVVGKESVVIPNSDGTCPRYDRVVIRCDYSERSCGLSVIKGTPGVNPAVPDIIRDGTYFDISLCTVYVESGITSITQTVISDTRSDNSVCGWVTGLISQIDTTDLFLQFEAQWIDFINQLGESDHVTITTVDPEMRDVHSLMNCNLPMADFFITL